MEKPVKDYPSFYIFTLGNFAVKRLQRCQVDDDISFNQEEVAEEEWESRATSAQAILKLLISSETRSASKALLAGRLWPDKDEDKARNSLRAATAVLRRILRNTAGKELLVTTEQGEVLKLAGQSEIWVDIDALQETIAQAIRTRDETEALRLWKQAHELLQGDFLAHDLHSEWAQNAWVRSRRQQAQVARSRVIRGLTDTYLHMGRIELAEEALQKYIANFPTDQDALCRLLPILLQQGCYEEALSLYERTHHLLLKRNKRPVPQLQALHKQLQEYSSSINTHILKKTVMEPLSFIEPIQPESVLIHTPNSLSPSEIVSFNTSTISDISTVLGYKQAAILTEIKAYAASHLSYDELQKHLEQEIAILDSTKEYKNTELYTFSRRQFLISLAALPTALIPQSQRYPLTISTADFLSECTASITACWHLLKGKEINVVEQVISEYLSYLIHLSHQVSPYQKAAAKLTAQAFLQAGLVAVLQMNHLKAQQLCIQAISYSQIAEDKNLEVASLKHLATKFLSAKYPLKTLQTYQKALPLVQDVSPLLRSRTYLGLALAYAQCQQEQKALLYMRYAQEAFPQEPEKDEGYSYADCSLSSLYHYEGLMYLEFNQPEEAWNIFNRVEELKTKIAIPERTILEILNCKAEAAVAQRNMELAIAHVQASIEGAYKLNSEKRFYDSFSIYKQMCLLWPHEKSIKQLAEYFHK